MIDIMFVLQGQRASNRGWRAWPAAAMDGCRFHNDSRPAHPALAFCVRFCPSVQ